MTRHIADDITIDRSAWLARTPIHSSDYDGVIRTNHRGFARSGSRIGGRVFEPAFTTTNDEQFTQVNETTGGVDLSTYRASGVVMRAIASGGTPGGVPAQYTVGLYGRLQNAELRVTIERQNADGTTDVIDTVSIARGSSLGIRRGAVTLSLTGGDNDGAGGVDVGLLTFTPEIQAADGVTGELTDFLLLEDIAYAGDIPTDWT